MTTPHGTTTKPHATITTHLVDSYQQLRYRHNNGNGLPEAEQPTVSDGHHHVAISPRKKVRVNRILGRLVPIILLVYICFAYDLVVYKFTFGYLYKIQKQNILPILLWLVPAHGVFITSLTAYLQVFFTRSASNRSSWWLTSLGKTFVQPTGLDLSNNILLCQPDGQPIRCWRDQCDGRIKTFRMRHCGDCQTCRVDFDHHCAWFDNDITAPSTLRPFLYLLVSVPPLFAWCLGPLIRPSLSVLSKIYRFSRNEPAISSKWWSKWYSWVGGPIFRWMVGWSLGARKWSQERQASLPHVTAGAPLVVGFGALFTTIAIILASSTLKSLSKGWLTVDVERQKAFCRLKQTYQSLLAKNHSETQAKLIDIRAKMESLNPRYHFRIPLHLLDNRHLPDSSSFTVVSFTVDQGLFDLGRGWKQNLYYYLFNNRPSSNSYNLPQEIQAKILQEARHQQYRPHLPLPHE